MAGSLLSSCQEPIPLGPISLETLSRRYSSPDALSARIKQVTKREAELRNERTYLEILANRQHNGKLPIARLPDEVLQTILCFDHAHTPLREMPRRNASLMQVSHRWMMTVMGYAHLWSSFAVRLPPRHRNTDQHLSKLISRTRTFIARSKNSPLYLQISPGLNHVVESHLRDCFVRCNALDVHAFSSSTRDVPPLPYSHLLGSVTDLSLTAHKMGNAGTAPPMLPDLETSGCHLRRLTVKECEYNSSIWETQFPPTILSSSLISLTVHASLDPTAFVGVLSNCHYLRYVSYTRDATSALKTASPGRPPPDIFLFHMESLIITGENDVLRALGRLSAPNLIYLEVKRTYNSRAISELPLWLAPPPGSARFPKLRAVTLLHLAEWQPWELERFFLTQPALEHFHTISLSEVNIRGLLALVDPTVCARLNTLLIQVNDSPAPLMADTLLGVLEKIWAPRKQAYLSGGSSESGPAADSELLECTSWFTVRVDGAFEYMEYLKRKLATLFDLQLDETVGPITPFEIPLV